MNRLNLKSDLSSEQSEWRICQKKLLEIVGLSKCVTMAEMESMANHCVGSVILGLAAALGRRSIAELCLILW